MCILHPSQRDVITDFDTILLSMEAEIADLQARLIAVKKERNGLTPLC
jgi:hypothetical protein